MAHHMAHLAQMDRCWPLLCTVIQLPVNLSGLGHVPLPLSFVRVPLVFLSRYSTEADRKITSSAAIKPEVCRAGPEAQSLSVHLHLATHRSSRTPASCHHIPHTLLILQEVEDLTQAPILVSFLHHTGLFPSFRPVATAILFRLCLPWLLAQDMALNFGCRMGLPDLLSL